MATDRLSITLQCSVSPTLTRSPQRHHYASNEAYEQDWYTWRALQRDNYLTPAEGSAKTEALAEQLARQQG